MQVPILTDLVLIFALSLPVLYICHRLNIPTVVAFLLTGMLIGPSGFDLIQSRDEVDILAEVGVVLLLFTIGIEFSLENLLRIKRTVLIGGALQVVLTGTATFLIVSAFGASAQIAAFVGLLVTHSSTTIMLKILQERGQIDAPHGGAALGVSIFQDVCSVPMVLAIPILAGTEALTPSSLGILGAKIVGAVTVVILLARWLVPRVLYRMARTQDNELFLLVVVFVGFATAWLTSQIGLSLALGAFLAGLIISESEYSERALGSVLNFRDVFTSFFFVSVGLLMDVRIIMQSPFLVIGIAVGIILMKFIMAFSAVLVLGLPFQTAALAGVALAQIGEFAFVMLKPGLESGLLTRETYGLILSVSVITMIAAPFYIMHATSIVKQLERLPIPNRIRRGITKQPPEAPESDLSEHLIVIGYGLTGRNVVRAAIEALIPYEIIELNPDTVHAERDNGEVIHYGDASQPNVLIYAGIKRAKVLVITIPDAVSTRRIVEVARRLNPDLHIIARTRYVREMEQLYALGANEVIPEEYETSVEIFSRVMHSYLVPYDVIDRFIAEVRADGYEMLRDSPVSAPIHVVRHLQGLDITTFQVAKSAPVIGRSLADISLRKNHKVTALAIHRAGDKINVPDGDAVFHAGDLVVVAGCPDRLAEVAPLFRAPTDAPSEAE